MFQLCDNVNYKGECPLPHLRLIYGASNGINVMELITELRRKKLRSSWESNPGPPNSRFDSQLDLNFLPLQFLVYGTNSLPKLVYEDDKSF